jgi:hypothetical protein
MYGLIDHAFLVSNLSVLAQILSPGPSGEKSLKAQFLKISDLFYRGHTETA